MKQRSTRPIVLLGVSVLVFLILGVAFVAVSLPCLSAHADGNVLKVPDDYPTIQAAIDAAAEGNQIWVAEGVYAENLSITKGITLTGGWDPTFSTRHPGDSTIDGQGLGRVISITCAANDTIVAIDGFTIMNGDASGLGALELPEVPPSLGLSAGAEERPVAQGRDPVNPTGHAADLRAHLAELAARGLYPGGASALQAMLEQLEWRTAQAEQARARANSVPARGQADPDQGPGAGGGVYSWNASLHLLNSTIVDNVASQDGQGAGGGIYVGQAAPSGVRIAGNVVVRNVASGGDDGWGGGLYVYLAPGVIIEDNGFVDNVGSAGGYDTIGLGGGLEVDASPNAVVRRNEIERNTANTAWDGQSGAGGGMHLQGSSGAELRANVLRSNLAALRNHGNGGGLFLFESDDVLLADNTIAGNWAVMFGEEHINGGGALLDRANRVIFTGNTVEGNAAGVYVRGLTGDVCLGGGLLVAFSNNPQVADNAISGNVACHFHYGGGQDGIAHGGGGVLQLTYQAEVSGNTFTDNVGSLSDMTGDAGGLYVDGTRNSHVRGNVFQENRGGTDGDGGGGALVLIGWEGVHLNTTVESNLFLHNQASASLNLASGSSGGACADTLTTGSTFINNVVAGNVAAQGGGIVLQATRQGQLVNNTLVDNAGSGVTVDSPQSPITLVNNIVVSHTMGISVTQGSTITVSYTLWHGNDADIGGDGTINQTHPVMGDPAFADPAAGDYHLTLASAARDAGDPAGVPPAPDQDADGVARPQGPAVDIGAYEWQGHWQYLPLAFKSFTQRVGWAIGDDAAGTAVIVHTADSGLTWEVQGDSTAWTGLEGNDISAVDDLTAWAALGSGPSETAGAILHTTDGGTTWVTQTIPAGLAGGIKGVKGLSRHAAWAASLAGTILHTTDGGSTWNVVPHPTAPITQVNRMDALGTNVWVADASAAGALVHSSDGGLTWQAIYLPGDSPLTVHAFSPLAVWVSGSDIDLNPSFYRTVDGGDQWVRVDKLGALDHLDDVCAASPDDAWGVANGDGVSGRIWRAHVAADGTPDAKNITPPELGGYTPGGVTCLDTSVAWVVAQKGVPPDPTKPLGIILHTVDGEHWVQGSAPTNIRYWKVSFASARR